MIPWSFSLGSSSIKTEFSLVNNPLTVEEGGGAKLFNLSPLIQAPVMHTEDVYYSIPIPGSRYIYIHKKIITNSCLVNCCHLVAAIVNAMKQFHCSDHPPCSNKSKRLLPLNFLLVCLLTHEVLVFIQSSSGKLQSFVSKSAKCHS